MGLSLIVDILLLLKDDMYLPVVVFSREIANVL